VRCHYYADFNNNGYPEGHVPTLKEMNSGKFEQVIPISSHSSKGFMDFGNELRKSSSKDSKILYYIQTGV